MSFRSLPFRGDRRPPDVIDLTRDDEIQNIASGNRLKSTSPVPSLISVTGSHHVKNVIQARQITVHQTVRDNRLAVNIGGNITRTHFRKGQCVEFIDGNFMRISRVELGISGQVYLIGDKLVPAEKVKSIISNYENEVVWQCLDVTEANNQSPRRSLVERWARLHNDPFRKQFKRNADEVMQERKIVFTNRSFAELSVKAPPKTVDQNVPPSELLFCRWKASKFGDGNHQAGRIQRLTAAEAQPGFVTDNSIIRELWRGSTILGGSHLNLAASQSKEQTYTFGDAFCGGGGVSTGARTAGLRVQWAVDHDDFAIRCYRQNADGYTSVFSGDIYTFINDALAGRRTVDVLHISPPCQPFSPAHTVPSPERDEMNQAAMFACDSLIKRTKPRVVTIEETDGLVNRHPDYFHALLNMFISNGYSVHWKVLRCDMFDIPQIRKRLVIIAAGPGETLPPFPQATTSIDGIQLNRTPTISDIIALPDWVTHHEGDAFTVFQPPKTPFSANTYAHTITTSGGQNNYHPSGMRSYSIRELACLNGFPLYHIFPPIDKNLGKLRRVIGNAVPPKLAEKLYTAIIAHLRGCDYAEMHQAAHTAPIVIED